MSSPYFVKSSPQLSPLLEVVVVVSSGFDVVLDPSGFEEVELHHKENERVDLLIE